jgi:hypothetical protein
MDILSYYSHSVQTNSKLIEFSVVSTSAHIHSFSLFNKLKLQVLELWKHHLDFKMFQFECCEDLYLLNINTFVSTWIVECFNVGNQLI